MKAMSAPTPIQAIIGRLAETLPCNGGDALDDGLTTQVNTKHATIKFSSGTRNIFVVVFFQAVLSLTKLARYKLSVVASALVALMENISKPNQVPDNLRALNLVPKV